MRELEFLPAWYPVMRRRRTLAVTQSYATAALMVGLLLWGIVGHQRVMQTQAQTISTTDELKQVRGELKMLDEQLRLKQQLQHQDQVLRKIGLPVDATRLLGELDHLMGSQTFLVSLVADTEETVRNTTPPGLGQTKTERVERRLRVTVVGVAPSDADVANFLAGLSSRTYFDQVAMTYTRDRDHSGRLMREFEVSFVVNLNAATPE